MHYFKFCTWSDTLWIFLYQTTSNSHKMQVHHPLLLYIDPTLWVLTVQQSATKISWHQWLCSAQRIDKHTCIKHKQLLHISVCSRVDCHSCAAHKEVTYSLFGTDSWHTCVLYRHFTHLCFDYHRQFSCRSDKHKDLTHKCIQQYTWESYFYANLVIICTTCFHILELHLCTFCICYALQDSYSKHQLFPQCEQAGVYNWLWCINWIFTNCCMRYIFAHGDYLWNFKVNAGPL